MITLSKFAGAYSATCRKIYVVSTSALKKNGLVLMAVLGLGLLSAGLVDLSLAQTTTPGSDFDDTAIVDAASAILGQFIEGSFGALIMIVAGLVAIIAAAMGAYRAAMACLVIAVGAFVLRSFVTLFFGQVVN